MILRDIMTEHVESIPSETSIRNAAEKMASLDVGAVPVVENDQPVGFITDRDITIRAVAEGLDPETPSVRDIMTPGVESLYEDQDVEDAAMLMEKQKIRRVLVVDREGQPVGIVSLGDLAVRSDNDQLTEEVLEEISSPSEPNRLTP